MRTKLTILFAIAVVLTTTAQQWKAYHHENSGLANDTVNAIAIDTKGNKWFGTNNGLSMFDDTHWVTYTTNDGLSTNKISAIGIDSKGNKWVGGRLNAHFNNSTMVSTIYSYGYPSKFNDTTWTIYKDVYDINSIATDIKGNVWFATWGMPGTMPMDIICLVGYDGSQFKLIFENDDFHGSAVATDNSGNLWFTADDGLISKYTGSKVDTSIFFHDLINFNNAIAFDKAGNIWIGTTQQGLIKLNSKSLIKYSTTDGLASNNVKSLGIDKNGNIWAGTNNGVTKFDGIKWTTFTTKDGLINNVVNSIAIDSSNSIWFGTNGGVSELVEQPSAVTNEATILDIKISIEPATEKLNLNCSNLISQTSAYIYDINGIQLYSSNINSDNTEIDMSGFSSGLYLVKVVCKNNLVVTKKIMKI